MTKEEYLKKLQSKIKKLPDEEVYEAIEYYHQYFEEAGAENSQAVIASLGSPAFVASQILADYATKDLDTHKNTTKKNFSAIWFIILATVASPIALPLALFIICLAVTLILVCGVTILTFFIFIIGLPICGLFSIISGAAVILQDWQTAIFFIGIGIIALGIGLLLFSPFVQFSKKVSASIVKLLKKLLDTFSMKRKEEI
ncbi:DUF1700 domain-containing protein [Bacillus sp. Au-Bac7]|uniref:DUF1700 domain-containing protein n=1 Tax=Bacillus sp. Au-Bac7 TaxID=2906458 RepID=UPI001E33003E|nr:DUF1700 domain-containing protein [Bacillus sp. Au-Bac7]MCE4049394.1 DUF1700 domain-containing protein [Bacillus sp. Au-Bac7]